MGALIRKVVKAAPPRWLTFILIFVGVLSSVATDAGYLILLPQTLLAAYRVGDSPVNVLAPLMVYLPFMVTVAQRYKKDAGIGTIIALMVPYAMWILITWTVLYLAWFLLGIPWGPGPPVHMP